MDDESMKLLAGHAHAELLRRPRRGRMFRHVRVQDPPGALSVRERPSG
jgi:hypothetical protein